MEARTQTQKAETMTVTPDLSQYSELPQWGVGVSPDYQIILTVSFGLAQHTFYLCDTDNYEDVARKLHKNIMDAGVAARRAKRGIVVATGDVKDHVRPAEGRKLPGKGRSGT